MPVEARSAFSFSMNERTLENVVAEIRPLVEGQRFGRVFVLGKARYAVDLRLPDGNFLFLSAEAREPRLYLVCRKFRDLEKASSAEDPFASALRRNLANGTVTSFSKLPGDRIVRMEVAKMDEMEGLSHTSLLIHLTGRSADVLIVGENGLIIESLKHREGSRPGDTYQVPEPPPGNGAGDDFDQAGFETLSEALDSHYLELDKQQRLESAYRSAGSSIKNDIRKRRRLRKALLSDLKGHGEPEEWKKKGDLLLANSANAKRVTEGFEVTDYFDESTPTVVIEADEGASVAEAAEDYFRRYTKSRNAAKAIGERLGEVEKEIGALEAEQKKLREAFESGDEQSVFRAAPEKKASPKRSGKKRRSVTSGARSFLSRDGFEILVGKRSKDNDHLTFRVANSLDTWLHAADYPGSHVVIRNPGRKEIPPSTLADAARLAAFYSKARGESKAAVHYTLKKFVHKPKGARPGLVSLADFKTIMVEPSVPDLVRKDH